MSPAAPGDGRQNRAPKMLSIRGTLQKRIILALLLVLGLSIAGLSLFLRGLLHARFDDALAAQAQLLSAFVAEELAEAVEVDLSELSLPEFEPGPEAQYFELWLGLAPVRQAARSASLQGGRLARIEIGDAAPRLWDLPLPDGRPGRAVALRISVPPARPPGNDPEPAELGAPRPQWAHLVVARERVSLDRVWRQVGGALALLGILLLLLVPLIVTKVARRALRPLDRFADQVARIDAQSLISGFAVQEEVPDELQPISAKLNDLLARLHASFERERRFSADVAHELRTPLAELRAIAEVALRFPPDPSARSTAFEDVRDAAVQLDHLLSSLRTLAACEGGVQSVALETVDVGQLAEKAWTRFDAAARTKSLTISVSAPVGLVVHSDPVLLASVIGNLFSNAIEYAPAGGTLQWSVAPAALSTPASVIVSVSNSNASLRPEDLAHVFAPFWRKDAARTGGVHSGIGLSLAKAFADLLSAQLTLALEGPNLVRAQLTLPA